MPGGSTGHARKLNRPKRPADSRCARRQTLLQLAHCQFEIDGVFHLEVVGVIDVPLGSKIHTDARRVNSSMVRQIYTGIGPSESICHRYAFWRSKTVGSPYNLIR